MGWDAQSAAKVDWGAKKLQDPTLAKMFIEAHKYVRRKTGSVDGDLMLGGLDCSACADMLVEATGVDVYSENPWSRAFVKTTNEKADWDFEYDKSSAWAYWSARKFLETCAKANLSIRFTY